MVGKVQDVGVGRAVATVVAKDVLAPKVTRYVVQAPEIARLRRPGQFVMVRLDEGSERIPLTIADADATAGTITLVVQEVGFSTAEMARRLTPGAFFRDVLGPLGTPTHIEKVGRVIGIGGGIGIAPLHPIVQAMRQAGNDVGVILGARTREQIVMEEEMRRAASRVRVMTDDGSAGEKGLVTEGLRREIAEHGKPELVVAIGPLVMMRAVAEVTREFGIRTFVSLNPVMIDGTGMCGGCRVSIGGKPKFVCVDGPEFDAHQVDFDELLRRQRFYRDHERRSYEQLLAEGAAPAPRHEDCRLRRASISQGAHPEDHPIDRQADGEKSENVAALPELPVRGIPAITPRERMAIPRQPMPHQSASERVKNFSEVALGFDARTARVEALRCLQCKNPSCVQGCPVSIDIPGFIQKVAENDFAASFAILSRDTALPAVCGRVCPQESQCEGVCVLAKKGQPVAIGRLERFVADWAREGRAREGLTMDTRSAKGETEPKVAETRASHHLSGGQSVRPSVQKKTAIVGAGPAGLTAAADLARLGHSVDVFEALHRPGGVLVYGIPEFRLPKRIVEAEVEALKRAGVRFHNSVVIGRTITMDQLREQYDAVFVATGAGLPNFMGIPGESLNGVYAANEYLTRANLMKAYDPDSTTPIARGRRVAVIGGGNVAMDAARTARRLGAEEVILVYRRTRAEMPARVEEVEHAEEEGIHFHFLHNPLRYEGDSEGRVNRMICEKMALGEPDASGRRKPVPTGEKVELVVDAVIVAIGNGPNPLVPQTTPGLRVKKWGNILVEKATGKTSLKPVWAGGDIVLGAATVILAMGAGRAAAASMHQYLTTGEWVEPVLDS